MAGGLATTSTIVRADFWRLGQCRPGDSLRFKRISWDSARMLRQRTEDYLNAARRYIESGKGTVELIDTRLPEEWTETILHRIPGRVEVVFRQSGDSYLHVTYGPMTASASTRAHIQHRVEKLKKEADIIAVIAATRCKTAVTTLELTIQLIVFNLTLSKSLKARCSNAWLSLNIALVTRINVSLVDYSSFPSCSMTPWQSKLSTSI